MPGLPYENLPAAQLQEQLQQTEKYLKSTWDADMYALKGKRLDKKEFNVAYKQLYSKHLNLLNTARYKNDQQRLAQEQAQRQQEQEREQVKKLIRQPQERDRAQEADLRMRLDPEAERLVFPEEEYILPSYLRSQGFIQNRLAYADAAPDQYGLEWGPPRKKKQDLIEQYQRWRESELYDTKSTQQQQQLDREWDILMFSSTAYNAWWGDKTKRKPVVEAQALRSKGKIASAMRKKVAGITPLGQTLNRDKTKRSFDYMLENVYVGNRGPDEQVTEQMQKPIRQRNRKTGQERISYDGGKTWQIVTGK